MLTLAVLSGGISSRMGQDKGLMPFQGRPLVRHVLDRLSPIADEIILSTNRPAAYAFLDLPLYPDLYPDHGPLGGLYTLLSNAKNPFVAAVACDMPFASRSLFEYAFDLINKTEADVIIPSSPDGLEPLHAVYRRETCLPVIHSALTSGKLKLIGWLPQVNTHFVPPPVTAQFDPHNLAFWNLNTPADFHLAEEQADLENE
jgi:molybdopterin-guanine dinucleotide biosynthesis protein A